LKKHCVFCGKKPEDKSKEHIVPRWLIELTGEANRNARFGFVKNIKSKDLLERNFAFDKFTFPACSVCNNKYADLEARAKNHIENILKGNSLKASELSDLLDWFDKVRVGAWLGMRVLDKNIADVDPNFHIETRMGQFDRLLIIEKSDFSGSRLNIGGADSFCFAITPSAFLLIINGYYFTNISGMFLCSRRLGFPYIKTSQLHPDRDEVEVDLKSGRERMMLPVLRKRIAEKGVRFFQPMYKGGLVEGGLDGFHDTEYVKNHSMDYEKGIGNIFKEHDNGIAEYSSDDEIFMKPQEIQRESDLYVRSAINILEWQLWFHKDLPDTSRLTKEQRKYIRDRFKIANKVNRAFINSYKKML